jgi:hypothetical protein
MNFKTTYILFGALVVLLAVAAVSLLTGPKPGEEGKLVRGIDAKDVTRVVVERHKPAEGKLVFVRVDKDNWKLEEPYEANLDGRSVENLVNDVLNARTVTKGVDIPSNPAQVELDHPPLSVALTTGGSTVTVNLGKVALGSGDKIVYANTSAQQSPVALKKSSLASLFRDLPEAQTAGDLFKNANEYRQQDLLLAGASFNAIDVASGIRLHGDKGDVVINKTSGGTWQFEKPAGYGDADVEGELSGAGTDSAPSGVKPLLTALAAIRVQSHDDWIENVTDFKQYGLEPPEGPRIEVVRQPKGENAAPITDSIAVGKKDDKSDKVFVRPGNERVVAKVSASLIDPVRKVLADPSLLRSRSLLPAGTAAVDAVDVKVGNDPPIELRKLVEGWKVYSPSAAPANANNQAVTELLNQLGNRRLVREFPDQKLTDADKGFDKPSAVVTLWVNGIVPEPKPEDEKEAAKKGGEEQQPPPDKASPKDKSPLVEKKDLKVEPTKDMKSEPKKDEKKEKKKEPAPPKLKEPTAKLIFGKRDKDLLYVRREMGGTKADFAVPESLLPMLTRGRLDYLDLNIPSFTPGQVTKLTLTRAGETWVVERETKDNLSHWVIRQPAQMAGKAAEVSQVNKVINVLAGLRANRLWAEKATDRELERFGLKPPRVTVTLSLNDEKVKERTYLLGAEADDKSHVYAKQGDRNLVFGVVKAIEEDVRQADLADLTVFRLNLSKVTGMKLNGWANLNVERKPQTLDLERKGPNNWSVKAPPTFKLSASQAESLLGSLAEVRAEKVVVYKTGPTPEFKLGPADGALAIDITIDGEKEPTTLNIGAETEGGKSYYAQSNKAPGDVFLVPKDRFEKFKANPNSLASE